MQIHLTVQSDLRTQTMIAQLVHVRFPSLTRVTCDDTPKTSHAMFELEANESEDIALLTSIFEYSGQLIDSERKRNESD